MKFNFTIQVYAPSMFLVKINNTFLYIRSPLLTQSRLICFNKVTKMIQFTMLLNFLKLFIENRFNDKKHKLLTINVRLNFRKYSS